MVRPVSFGFNPDTAPSFMFQREITDTNRKEIERRLKQLREEEQLQRLANLESRCNRMLAMQIAVYESTKRLHGTVLQNEGQKPSRADDLKAGELSGEEGKIVSGKNGKIVSDGPFAESKEAIGGYFLLKVDSLDEAVTIAQQCPGLSYGIRVEVRPVAGECPLVQKAREAQLVQTA